MYDNGMTEIIERNKRSRAIIKRHQQQLAAHKNLNWYIKDFKLTPAQAERHVEVLLSRIEKIKAEIIFYRRHTLKSSEKRQAQKMIDYLKREMVHITDALIVARKIASKS